MASPKSSISCNERLVDAATSLEMALKDKLWGDDEKLVAETQQSLSSFLHIVKSSGLRFPTGTIDDIEHTVTSTHIDRVKWNDLMDAKFKDYIQEWPALSKVTGREIDSKENFNGGLWMLFHHLIVSSKKDPDTVTENIKGFVKHFIACSECRNHFLRMWDFYDNGRKKSWGPNGADDAALWLWRAHNAASVTRALQADSLTFHLWPSPELCPTCSEGISDYGIPKWNEGEVLKFVKQEYRCGIKEDEGLSQLTPSYHRWFLLVIPVLMVILGFILFCMHVSRKRSGSYNSYKFSLPFGSLSGSSKKLLSSNINNGANRSSSGNRSLSSYRTSRRSAQDPQSSQETFFGSNLKPSSDLIV